ncbi:unnamed protein product, partial [Mesorhabditis spiculigera]
MRTAHVLFLLVAGWEIAEAKSRHGRKNKNPPGPSRSSPMPFRKMFEDAGVEINCPSGNKVYVHPITGDLQQCSQKLGFYNETSCPGGTVCERFPILVPGFQDYCCWETANSSEQKGKGTTTTDPDEEFPFPIGRPDGGEVEPIIDRPPGGEEDPDDYEPYGPDAIPGNGVVDIGNTGGGGGGSITGGGEENNGYGGEGNGEDWEAGGEEQNTDMIDDDANRSSSPASASTKKPIRFSSRKGHLKEIGDDGKVPATNQHYPNEHGIRPPNDQEESEEMDGMMPPPGNQNHEIHANIRRPPPQINVGPPAPQGFKCENNGVMMGGGGNCGGGCPANCGCPMMCGCPFGWV